VFTAIWFSVSAGLVNLVLGQTYSNQRGLVIFAVSRYMQEAVDSQVFSVMKIPHHGRKHFNLFSMWYEILLVAKDLPVFTKRRNDPSLVDLCKYVKPKAWISSEVFASFLGSLYESLTPVERREAGIVELYTRDLEVRIEHPQEWNCTPLSYSLDTINLMKRRLAILLPIYMPNHWTGIIVDRHRRKLILYDGNSDVPKYLVRVPPRRLRDCFDALFSPSKADIGSVRVNPKTKQGLERMSKPTVSFFRMLYYLKLVYDANIGIINLAGETKDYTTELDYEVVCIREPVQQDGYNCGPLVLCVFEAFLMGALLELGSSMGHKAITSKQMDLFRFHIMRTCIRRLHESFTMSTAAEVLI
jgi:hypothetical protein